MSKEPLNTDILDTPIGQLPLSEKFKARSTLLGFSTLRQITVSNKIKLRNHKDFSVLWYNELLGYLNEKGLLHLMDR